MIFLDADLLSGVDWVQNDNETDDIQEDENKEYINTNGIYIEENKL